MEQPATAALALEQVPRRTEQRAILRDVVLEPPSTAASAFPAQLEANQVDSSWWTANMRVNEDGRHFRGNLGAGPDSRWTAPCYAQ